MQTIGKIVNSMSDALEFNQATLSGCVDIIVVRQPDGTLKSTPFHVRFGKLKILKSRNTLVTISVNSEKTNLKMVLGEAGEGFFEEEQEEIIQHLKTETSKLAEKSKSEKQSKPSSIESSTENNGVAINNSLLKMLRLKSSPGVDSGNTRDTSGDIENVQEDSDEEGAQKVSDLIFLDESRPKALSMSAKNIQSSIAKLSPLQLHRAHSLGYVESQNFQKKNAKTLRPNTVQLESLNLKQGSNTITYTVKSNLQGLQQVTGNIFLWSHDANIIISDIDGTITKSDVMGHLMSMVGKDWSQPGIAPLYTNIKRNGYHLLYLTSRAIGQAKQTKEMVNSVCQDGKMLPQGPLITSPDQMLPSVKREIVFKRPELFKMAVLKDIRSIFPADHNPFHAGFGNRETDAIAYKSVGIPLEKVFIVNPKGHIHHHGHGLAKSYAIINTMIKDMFPGILRSSKAIMADRLNSENLLNIKDEQLLQANVIKVVC